MDYTVVTNGLFMVANARYYVHTGDTVYRDAAVDVWNKWGRSSRSSNVGINLNQEHYSHVQRVR
jgi:hypothetical protein